jgi:hypothetical protein
MSVHNKGYSRCASSALDIISKFYFYTSIFLVYYLNDGLVVLSSSVVDRGFELGSGQTKDYKIGICCFSAKHAALGRKSKDLLPQGSG